MSVRVLAVLVDDDLAPLVMERAASIAAAAPPAALLYVAVIESEAVAELELTDDSIDPLQRLEEEAGILFEAARTAARRYGIDPETIVIPGQDRALAEVIANQAAAWDATVIVIGEPRRGYLRRHISRSTAESIQQIVGPEVAVERVGPVA